MTDWRIPLFDLWYDEAEARAVQDVIASKWLTMGPKVKAFEEAFALRVLKGQAECAAVANCTCALELAVRLAIENWRRVSRRHEGDPVRPVFLVPDITFVATANACASLGADVDFVDIISPERPLMCPEDLEDKLEEHGNLVAAVMPVHYAGFDALSPILEVLAKHPVFIIEDCAHSPGANYVGTTTPIGTLGDVSCFSFFSNKNIATGEGGMIASRFPGWIERARLIRAHGMTSTTYDRHTGRMGEYDVVTCGHNFRCTEMTAALGLAQLDKLERGNARRREIYSFYAQLLDGKNGLRICFGDLPDQIDASSCHILPLICEDSAQKARIVAALFQNGIQTSHHYTPVSKLTAWRERASYAECIESWGFSALELTLPLYPQMTDFMVEEVCSVILEAAPAPAI